MLSQVPVECPQSLLKGDSPRRAVAVVNAASDIVLESAFMAQKNGLAHPFLIGKTDEVSALAKSLDWSSNDYEILNANTETEAAELAVKLVHSGDIQTIMKGQIHTDVFMRAIVDRQYGLRTDRRLSHIFHMTFPGSDRRLLITDAAVNIHPDLETKKAIILNGVDLAKGLGILNPHVALLSATEECNPRMPSSLDAAELAEWAESEVPDSEIHGPLAFDIAISPEAASIKGVEHPVAGNADIVVVPNIEAGNILFKGMVYHNSACAAGVVMGAKVPIVLTSRADPPASRLASLAVATRVSGTA